MLTCRWSCADISSLTSVYSEILLPDKIFLLSVNFFLLSDKLNKLPVNFLLPVPKKFYIQLLIVCGAASCGFWELSR
jgi:hypothetical protein